MTPRRPAIAIRWITALVEPPMAALVRMAFSNACAREYLRNGEIFLHHVDDAPARHAREHVAARIDRGIGGVARHADRPATRPCWPSSMPCPSSCSGRASGACTIRPRGIRRASSCRRARPPTSTTMLVPEPMSVPRYLPDSIGPPETAMVGRSTLAAPIRSAGVVLSQPTSSTTPSSGLARIDSSTSMLARLRYIIAVGRSSVSPSDITGNSSGKPPASRMPCLHVLGEHAEMRVARRQLRPRVADADDRAAVELVVRHAAVLGPASGR